jgi:hypothetical protein
MKTLSMALSMMLVDDHLVLFGCDVAQVQTMWGTRPTSRLKST